MPEQLSYDGTFGAGHGELTMNVSDLVKFIGRLYPDHPDPLLAANDIKMLYEPYELPGPFGSVVTIDDGIGRGWGYGDYATKNAVAHGTLISHNGSILGGSAYAWHLMSVVPITLKPLTYSGAYAFNNDMGLGGELTDAILVALGKLSSSVLGVPDIFDGH